ncbi:MAG: DinB family protein [Gemmatimonadaceae bacterium]
MDSRSRLHPRIAELTDLLSTTRTRLLAVVVGADAARLGVRPDGRGWSPAQVLDHLARVEQGVARLVAKRVVQARVRGLRGEDSTTSLLHSLDHRHIDDPTHPLAAPDSVAPAESASASTALQSLALSRSALLAAVHDGDGLALGEILHTHPSLGELNLYQWILFVALHEVRHTKQIVAALGTHRRPSA